MSNEPVIHGPNDPEQPAWGDAAALTAADLDPRLRRWLMSGGLLTERLRALLGAQLCPLAETQVELSEAERGLLQCSDRTGRLREICLQAGTTRYVYGATLIPATLLDAHPWLQQLGQAALGPTLAERLPTIRSAFRFRRVEPAEPLAQRALPGGPDGSVWARRSTFKLPGGFILVTEVFLPPLAPWPVS